MPGAVARAISRFEAGLERNVVLEALNDYLLALRFVLEGGGPADLGLAMRVAALCAEPEQRSETKAIVDRALALERELWSGEPAPARRGRSDRGRDGGGDRGPDARHPQGRRLRPPGRRPALDRRRDPARRRARRGRGRGPSSAAGPRSGTCRATSRTSRRARRRRSTSDEPTTSRRSRIDRRGRSQDDVEERAEDDFERAALDGRLRRLAGGRRGPRRRHGGCRSQSPRVESGSSHAPSQRRSTCSPGARTGARSAHRPPSTRASGATTASTSCSTSGRRERQKVADRVAYLFPRPETTEWDVRELSYDRRRRAEPETERRVS